MPKPLKLICLALALLFLPKFAQAQGGNLVSLGVPRVDEFPTISTTMEVRDEQGRFVSGLTAQDLMILEDGQQIPVDRIQEMRPGVQFVLAINPGVTFAIRDIQAKTRYDYILEALTSWAESIGDQTHDDLSLLVNGSPGVFHLSNPGEWLDALQGIPDDHRNANPDLQVLYQAIDIASDPSPKEGMEKVVLLITPNPERESIPTLESNLLQASQAGVRVLVWMISSESYFTSQGAIALQELAYSSGGEFFAFSGTETIPELESYIEPLRGLYSLSYTSKIASNGLHQLAVEVASRNLKAISPDQSFELSIEPPNPMFVSPPSKVYRALVSDNSGDQPEYSPNEQPIEIIVEFPDGYERPLKRTTLYVNGKIVSENTKEPFDVFKWDLSNIDSSEKQRIQVEAVDVLGMSSLSIELPVDITVQRLPDGFVAEVSRKSSILTAVIVLMSGAMLILALVMISRRRHQDNSISLSRQIRADQKDPPQQNLVSNASDFSRHRKLTQWASQLPNRLPWPQRMDKAEPCAFFERLIEPDSLEALTPSKPIAITSHELTLGSDPSQATLVLEEQSVADLHARLYRDKDGNFYVCDHGTVAGTWINYSPAGATEVPVEHGDLIHFGCVGFRFKVNGKSKIDPVITPGKAFST